MKSWIIRTAVSAAVLAVVFAFVPISDVWDALTQVSLTTWTAALAIFFSGHYLNALKLRVIVGLPSVPRALYVRAQYAGLVANLGLPGIAGGDLVRAAYLAPAAGTKRIALASVVDRVLDTLILVLIAAVALPIAGVPPAIAQLFADAAWWLVTGALVVGGLGALVVAARARSFAGRLLTDAAETFRARRHALAAAAGISILVQCAFVLTNVWLAQSAGVTTGVAAWFVAWPLSKLIAVLPISLGGIGVREAALVSLLAPYGAPARAVVATGILWQSVLAVSGAAGLLLTQLARGSTGTTAPVER